MHFTTLTKELMSKHLERLLDLEKFYSKNPSELWTPGNFMMDLPKKWDWSQIAMEDESVKGYVIASQKEDYAFIHRTFVEPSLRGSLVYMRLIKSGEQAVRKDGIKQSRWYCSTQNARVHQFHMQTSDGILESKTVEGIRYNLFYREL